MLFCARRCEIAQNYQQCVCLATFITNALSPAGHSLSTAKSLPESGAGGTRPTRRLQSLWKQLVPSLRVLVLLLVPLHTASSAALPCLLHLSLAGLPTCIGALQGHRRIAALRE